MNNDKGTWRLTVKLPSGEPILTLMVEGEVLADAATNAAATLPGTGEPDGQPKMTEPQKRYLFRLLAAQGIEGTSAEAHLKEHFKVQTLTEVPKAAASEYIDQLVTRQKEANAA